MLSKRRKKKKKSNTTKIVLKFLNHTGGNGLSAEPQQRQTLPMSLLQRRMETFQQQLVEGPVDTFGSVWLYIIGTFCKFLAGPWVVNEISEPLRFVPWLFKSMVPPQAGWNPLGRFFPYNIITHSCWECTYSDFQI